MKITFFSLFVFLVFMVTEIHNKCFKVLEKKKSETMNMPVDRKFKENYEKIMEEISKPKFCSLECREILRFCKKSEFIESSFGAIKYLKENSILKSLPISFMGDFKYAQGDHAKYQWFDQISAEVFNPKYGLFKYSNSINDMIEIDPKAKEQENYLEKFEVLGLFVGMAIYHQKIINAYFSVVFLKSILEKPFDLDDVNLIDPEISRSLDKVREDPESMSLNFADEDPCTLETHFLKPDGDGINVDRTNCEEYISLKMNWRYVEQVQEEMTAFKNGFSLLIPNDLISKFNEDELQFMLSGEPEIKIDDWKKVTEYEQCYGCKVQKLFWKVVQKFDHANKVKLLQLVTGSTRIPKYRASFAFRIKCVPLNDPKRDFTVHTCWSQLVLPKFKTFEETSDYLIDLITEEE